MVLTYNQLHAIISRDQLCILNDEIHVMMPLINIYLGVSKLVNFCLKLKRLGRLGALSINREIM